MSYFLFGAGTLTGGLIVFFIFKIKLLRKGLKKEAKYNEEREFYRLLSEQVDLSGYKNTIDAIELERQRISADIHDDLAQSLSALFLDLDKAAEDSSATSSHLSQALVNISLKLETVIETLRDIIYGMLPGDLLNKNLVEAIEALCKRYNKIKGTRITFKNVGKLSPLSEQHGLQVYRITQELLNNCKKHSQASICHVQLQWSEKELVLTVLDNGVGLTNSIRKANRYGIRGIFVRCAMMKVVPRFNFPEKGLEFVLSMPLNQSSG